MWPCGWVASFTDKNNAVVKVDKTFGYTRDICGNLKIVCITHQYRLHHFKIKVLLHSMSANRASIQYQHATNHAESAKTKLAEHRLLEKWGLGVQIYVTPSAKR